MTKRLRIWVVCGVLACLVALAFGADRCHGQAWNPAPLNYWYSYYPGLYGRHSSAVQRGIPHFAAFPPVYYSHIVPRPYGYSPYAYVPGIVTPSFELCQPRYRCEAATGGAQSGSTGAAGGPISVPNPYFSPGTEETPRPEPVSGGPLRIRNPYFVETEDSLAGG